MSLLKGKGIEARHSFELKKTASVSITNLDRLFFVDVVRRSRFQESGGKGK